MTKGTATDARATYFSTRSLAADLAWLMSPANMLTSRLPERAEDESDGRGQGQGCHRVILHRLVEGTFEVASDFSGAVRDLAHLAGGAGRQALHAVCNLPDLIDSLVDKVIRTATRLLN
jgi:hypothetical protein